INVTDGGILAYRIQRRGSSKSIRGRIGLRFDPSKIPDGYGVNDIRTFYYDVEDKNWKKLKVDSVNYENHVIFSSLYFNGKTDFINGVLKVPTSPETKSFVPTMMKDIKYANPAEGVVSILPPKANSRGDVRTTFPLKL